MRYLRASIIMSALAFPSFSGAQPDWDLSLPREFAPLVGSSQTVELADVDGDGVLDAVVAGRWSGAYGCYAGTGGGGFGAEIFSGPLYYEPVDLVVDDFNGDGLPDIAAVNSATCGCSLEYFVSMVLGSSTGQFEDVVNTIVGPEPIQLEKADFNHDSVPDLAVLSVGTSTIGREYGQSLHLLEGDGEGGFVSPFVIAIQTTEPQPHFVVGDFDGDEWPDLALSEPGAARIRVALNGRSSARSEFAEIAVPWTSPAAPRCMAAGDFTGDGVDDLVVVMEQAGGGGGEVRILVADGSGGANPGAAATLSFPPTCIAVADIDDDRALDIALGGGVGGGGAEACVIRGDGQGGLGNPSSAPLFGEPAALAVGNLDGAGARDLVLTQPGSGFLSSILVTRHEAGPARFVRGDANGDGRDDISDAVAELGYLFLGGETDCLEALDADDNFETNITDPIYLLGYLFMGGPAPPPPFPEAGEDPAGVSLGCERR
jgi:hypothetical protein